MTTPRVTVPVEPTEAMIDFASFHMVGAGAFTKEDRRLVVASVYRAMLSAAPAPEGGAVPDDVRRLVVAARNVAFDTPTQSELRALDLASEAFASRVPWDDEPEALATREVAPACEMCNGRGEVGGPTGQTPESFDYVTERCPDCGGTGKLEAPAREDALRVAVEALEAARKVIELFRDEDVLSEGVHTGLRKGADAKDAHDLWTAIRNSKTSAWSDAIAFAIDPYFSMWGGDAAVAKIDQALAALQAEQGAK